MVEYNCGEDEMKRRSRSLEEVWLTSKKIQEKHLIELQT